MLVKKKLLVLLALCFFFCANLTAFAQGATLINTDKFGDDNNLFVRNISYTNVWNREESLIERVYRYEIPDIFEILDRVIQEDIAPIEEITVQPIINNKDMTDFVVT